MPRLNLVWKWSSCIPEDWRMHSQKKLKKKSWRSYAQRHVTPRNHISKSTPVTASITATSRSFTNFRIGIGKAMGWRNIDVQKKPSGEPFLVFSGPAHELATQRAVTAAFVTLSHTEHHAIACIVLDG